MEGMQIHAIIAYDNDPYRTIYEAIMIEITTLSPTESLVQAVLIGLDSEHTRRAYGRAIRDFLGWRERIGNPGLDRALVQKYRSELEAKQVGPSSINLRLSAIRKLVQEAVNHGHVDALVASAIQSIPGVKQRGVRTVNWLTLREAQELLRRPDTTTKKGLRDRAILAVIVGCGLRRSEVANLRVEEIQLRDARWAIIYLIGKGKRVRTVPMPSWTKQAIDEWTTVAEIETGNIFRPMNKGDNITGASLTPKAIRDVVALYAPGLAPHDLRRTYAKLAHKGGAALDQIQITLGHASIATTERYLGVDLDLTNAPGDHISLKL
jgi:integrase